MVKKNNGDQMKYQQEIIIRPVSKLGHYNFHELYRYRYLLWSMIWKDIRINFDDMILGVFWAISLPLSMLVIFVFVRNYSGANMYVNISYSLYLYSGLILWFHFREATASTARSIMRDAGIIKKVYYPRIISPIVPSVSRLYTLSIAMLPLILMMIWYRTYPDWKIVFLPVVLVQCTVLILAIGMIFACLSVIKNDFEKFLSICLYLGLFVSPVIFAPEMIPKKGRIVYDLNPMVGTLLAFRSSLFHNFPFPIYQFTYSLLFSVILLIVGIIMYQKTEKYMADKL
ncbi:ABC transporter permease [Thermodesulfobacteriota bacterium]